MFNSRNIVWLLLLSGIIVLAGTSCASTLINLMNKKVKPIASDAAPVDHTEWDELLKKHVKPNGLVDYQGLTKDSTKLDGYISLLKKSHPDKNNWSREEAIAFWINAYNAFTVKKVLEHYPVNSIKDIKGGITFLNTVWDEKFIEIGDQTYDLNNIEHGILRKYYKEPRIHFAVNCASISCPNLAPFAFDAAQLNEQLDLAARIFVSDSSKNIIQNNMLCLSKIFKWYKPDFTTDTDLRQYISQYTEVEFDQKVKIKYLDYDWGLNDTQDNISMSF